MTAGTMIAGVVGQNEWGWRADGGSRTGRPAWLDYDVAAANDYTMWTRPWIHWQVGGAFVTAVITAIVGVAAYFFCKIRNPASFKGQTLTRSTETLVPDPDA